MARNKLEQKQKQQVSDGTAVRDKKRKEPAPTSSVSMTVFMASMLICCVGIEACAMEERIE